jgi:hypothetical protein
MTRRHASRWPSHRGENIGCPGGLKVQARLDEGTYLFGATPQRFAEFAGPRLPGEPVIELLAERPGGQELADLHR